MRRDTPVHVTLRVSSELPRLRRRTIYRVILTCLKRVNPALGMRVVHHSVQGDHIHLIVEVDDQRALSRGMQGLSIRLAKALNGAAGREGGSVFTDRYHAEILRSPRQVRNALAYVLNNHRHHDEQAARPPLIPPRRLDPCSSAPWFDGWRRPYTRPREATGPPPHPPPRTWLLREGWRRHGLIDPSFVPGPRLFR